MQYFVLNISQKLTPKYYRYLSLAYKNHALAASDFFLKDKELTFINELCA